LPASALRMTSAVAGISADIGALLAMTGHDGIDFFA
jgi:hypothetical protein